MVHVDGINHICGPRIVGTRITVYDVYYYLVNGRKVEWIAELFKLSVEQIQAAVRYIDVNKEDVLAVHQEIEERNARGNPPEIEEKLRGSHDRLMAKIEELKRAKRKGANGEEADCRR